MLTLTNSMLPPEILEHLAKSQDEAWTGRTVEAHGGCRTIMVVRKDAQIGVHYDDCELKTVTRDAHQAELVRSTVAKNKIVVYGSSSVGILEWVASNEFELAFGIRSKDISAYNPGSSPPRSSFLLLNPPARSTNAFPM
jgi:hypothetical protein